MIATMVMNHLAADSPADPLLARLAPRWCGSPAPLFLHADGLVVPAASAWSASRIWRDLFREAGLIPGDRVALAAADPTPGWVAALIGAWRAGLTVLCTRSAEQAAPWRPRWILGPAGGVGWTSAGTPAAHSVPMARSYEPTTEVRVVLPTSGTKGGPRLIALGTGSLLAVVDSHLALLGYRPTSRVFSVLPWHHAFGLVLEFLCAAVSGATVVRAPGKIQPEDMLQRLRTGGITHLLSTPATLQGLLALPGGGEVLRTIPHGLVGGAPLTAELAAALRGTGWRIGYGQTEASPGICLSRPGHMEPGLLGHPVGCEVQRTPDGRLRFRGPNACFGHFEADTFHPAEPGRWVDTGDIVREEQGSWWFAGRRDDRVKLSNGLFFDPHHWEERLGGSIDAAGTVVAAVRDGASRFHLVWTGSVRPADFARQARALLGPLAARLGGVWPWSLTSIPQRSKGDWDRVALWRRVEEMGPAVAGDPRRP